MYLCFSHKYQMCSFVVFTCTKGLQESNKSINFDYDQQKKVQTPNSYYSNTEKTNLIQPTTVPSQCEKLPWT